MSRSKDRRKAARRGNAAAEPDISGLSIQDKVFSPRSVTGNLTSHPRSRDVHIEQYSLLYHGQELFADTTLELNHGRRYGVIGENGCGKSTLLESISERDIPIPDHIDVFHLKREIEPSEKTALAAVMEVDEERLKLERMIEECITAEGADSENLMDLYERLDELEADTAEMRAAKLLSGLGFTKAMQAKMCKDFSGGWRMRIALARALFVRPSMLLLDEPTNHLDLEACVWLEMELKKYDRILIIISHSQDFLNGVCTNIIHCQNRQLKYYSGNYDQYIQTRAELEEHQMKRYHSEQENIAKMKDYIARFGHGSAKLARQAKSKEKLLNKVVAGGLTEAVSKERVLNFRFNECAPLPPPVLMVQNVSFGYPGQPLLYKDLDFGLDLDSRIALVGPNGAGKSTLLKLIDGGLIPSAGQVRRHNHLKFGRYHQHLAEHLDLSLSPVQYMMQCFPEINEVEQMRRAVGRFGLTGKAQMTPMSSLSDGQRCRVIFAWLAFTNPQMLLLDEPTNHLDLETIDSLADAINEFDGGLVLVSHDFRLISQVAEEIWVCDKGTITKWDGDILSYKETLRQSVENN
ncbi:ATP-binding cassette sub-family F member 2 [Fonticula alba]|uniref:ATP-binding cassette sub-family F member 2 n=1 Tax=Fonticula alba TaxID=691883 RepID=A0A058ZF98_FONAL|nr:ATP-binding cassette sub-family F member 2 [Fonticula alba]KCV73024.1 ATP-binding cassette sub-family F member 2 [Fonticula alba]|eukprot:XP_009492725.1 ATP-binding cassette sub-family F member 2 [Fonticula alba]